MKITTLSTDQVNELFLNVYGLFLEFKDNGVYLSFSRDDLEFITWSEFLPHLQVDDMVSVGLPLFAYSTKKKLVFPSLMSRLSGYPTIEIKSVKQAIKFSIGESVTDNSFKELEQQQVIITHNGFPLAFGQILFGEFQPLIDVGWYLREAEKSGF